jgi:hypothetical protein
MGLEASRVRSESCQENFTADDADSADFFLSAESVKSTVKIRLEPPFVDPIVPSRVERLKHYRLDDGIGDSLGSGMTHLLR